MLNPRPVALFSISVRTRRKFLIPRPRSSQQAINWLYAVQMSFSTSMPAA